MVKNQSDSDIILDIIKGFDRFEDLPLISWMDFSEPRQIEVFWVDSPLEYQHIFITHDENRPNNEVIINGPFSGSEFLGELESVLTKPRWQQPVDEAKTERFDPATRTSIEASTRKELVIHLFQGIEERFGSEIFREPDTRLRGSSRVDGEQWLLSIRGNVFNLDSVEELIENTFGDTVEEIQAAIKSQNDGNTGDEEQSQESEGDDEEQAQEVESAPFRQDPNALGTYIYEPVWVGGIPDLDFKDKILINPPMEYDTVCSTKIGGHEVVVTKDGFVGVEVLDEDTALRILNTIFGISILIEHPCEAATRDDLIELVIDEEGAVIDRQGNPGIRRHHASPELWMVNDRFNHRGPNIERDLIDEEYVMKVLSKCEDLFDEGNVSERINSTLQAYTHHVNGEFTQAFLLAWISIEQYIISKLDQHLKTEKDVNSERRRNMKRGGHWSASHLLELMEVSDCISRDRYEKVTQMRKKRNNVVHETEPVSKSESKQIVNLSLLLIDEGIFDDDKDMEFIT